MGIDLDLESQLSRFLNELREGRLPQPGLNELVIGTEMARQLEVGVGDEVVVVAPAADGSMGNDLFRIAGIFRTGLAELDATFAVLPLEALQALVALEGGRIHEVAVSTADPWIAPETAAALTASLASGGLDLEVAPWTELRPEMVEYVAIVDSFYFIVFVVVFGIAIFGVANTMLMATFERRREFAVMLALGTTPMTIVLTVLSEAAAIGLMSLVAGAAFTLPLMIWCTTLRPILAGCMVSSRCLEPCCGRRSALNTTWQSGSGRGWPCWSRHSWRPWFQRPRRPGSLRPIRSRDCDATPGCHRRTRVSEPA